VGLAVTPRPGFHLDEATAVVGRGDVDFAHARAALSDWAHFKLGWVAVFPERVPIASGSVVAVVVRHLGFWSVNGCRVVDVIEKHDDAPVFGFAYGTLVNHAECGEEIFKVSLSPVTGLVTYEIRAVSKARAPLARLGRPVTQAFQAKFRCDSMRAMTRAVLDRRA
jgi:uncharacterized protein (UPF0548 family)